MTSNIATNFSRQSLQKSKNKKTTHLYFNDKFLKNIPKIPNVHCLAALYLQNNGISEIRNLQNAEKLTNLYLQNNKIQKLEPLGYLKSLKQVYFSHNAISVVEGLENLQNLEELYLEKQNLQEGDSLCFDPRTIYGISHSLQILNISYNRMQTISCLAPLKCLRVLIATNNNLSDVEEICETIKDWFYLRELSLENNPVCKSRLYKENIIAEAYCLEVLDQKTVSEHTRSFLKRLHHERQSQNFHKTNLQEKCPDIVKKYSSAIQKAVSVNVLKQESFDIFDERIGVHIPWRTLPKPQVNSNIHLVAKRIKERKLRTQKTDDENQLQV